MRKKYLLIILPVMLVTLCLLAGIGYAIHNVLAGVLSDIFARPGELQMNRKYYYTLETMQSIPDCDYYVFYKNGTGDFYVAHGSYNYTIHFLYSISSGTITCTYKDHRAGSIF